MSRRDVGIEECMQINELCKPLVDGAVAGLLAPLEQLEQMGGRRVAPQGVDVTQMVRGGGWCPYACKPLETPRHAGSAAHPPDPVP